MREARIDLLRGVCLLLIFVGHCDLFLSDAFQHSRGFSDAAEFFVLLAGMSAGLAYYRPSISLIEQAVPVWRRLRVIYGTHILVSLVFASAALLNSRAAWLQIRDGQYDSFAHIGDHPIYFLTHLVDLSFAPGELGILPLYCVLLGILPMLIVLRARWGETIVLSVSVLAWTVAGLTRINLPNVAAMTGHWYFDPLSWQLLFVLGFCLGVRMRQGEAILPMRRDLFTICVAFLAISIPLELLFHFEVFFSLDSHIYHALASKTMLGPLPLVHVCAAVYVLWNLEVIKRTLSVRWLRPFCVLGRNSLPVFVCGLFAATVINALLTLQSHISVALHLLLLAIGIAIQFACGIWFDHLTKLRTDFMVRSRLDLPLGGGTHQDGKM